MSLHQQNPYIVSMQGSLKTNGLSLMGWTICGGKNDVREPEKASWAICGDAEHVRKQPQVAADSEGNSQQPHDGKGIEVDASDAVQTDNYNSAPEISTAFYLQDTSYLAKFMDDKNLQEIDVMPIILCEIFKKKRDESIEATYKPDDPMTKEYNLFDDMTNALTQEISEKCAADFKTLGKMDKEFKNQVNPTGKKGESDPDESDPDESDPDDPLVRYQENFSRVCYDDNVLYHCVHLCVKVDKPRMKPKPNTTHNFYLFKSLSKKTKNKYLFVYQGTMTHTTEGMNSWQTHQNKTTTEEKSLHFMNVKPDDELVKGLKKKMDDLFKITQASCKDGISYYECKIETDNGYWHDSAKRILQAGETIDHNSAMDKFVHAIAKRLFKIDYAEHKQFRYNREAGLHKFEHDDNFHVIVRSEHGHTLIFFCAKDHVPHNCTPCTKEHALGKIKVHKLSESAPRQSMGGRKKVHQGLYKVSHDRDLLANEVERRKHELESRGRPHKINPAELAGDLKKDIGKFQEPVQDDEVNGTVV